MAIVRRPTLCVRALRRESHVGFAVRLHQRFSAPVAVSVASVNVL